LSGKDPIPPNPFGPAGIGYTSQKGALAKHTLWMWIGCILFVLVLLALVMRAAKILAGSMIKTRGMPKKVASAKAVHGCVPGSPAKTEPGADSGSVASSQKKGL